jgi:hypothetical protein
MSVLEDTSEIIPCPVCHSEDIQKVYDDGDRYESCLNCGVRLMTGRKLPKVVKRLE